VVRKAFIEISTVPRHTCYEELFDAIKWVILIRRVIMVSEKLRALFRSTRSTILGAIKMFIAACSFQLVANIHQDLMMWDPLLAAS
jgi:hypothetical protein